MQTMESWSYGSKEDDDFGLPCEILHPSNTMAEATSKWSLENTPKHENSNLMKTENGTLRLDFVDVDFPLAVQQAITTDSIDELPDNVVSNGQVVASQSSSLNTGFNDRESSSKDSSSIIDSNAQESSLVDLKLGIFSDHEDPKRAVTKERTSVSCVPTKRVRSTSLDNSQTHICQVHGCNMDLNSSKAYHKKHKVCETHSKTAKVVVHGKTQRFCQQCSRFHLLVEFDGAKRSCRRRLAGHNERRRKPQIDNYARRNGQLPQHYCGGKYHATRTSFFCRNIFPIDSMRDDRYKDVNWHKDGKSGDVSIGNNPQKHTSVTAEELLSKSILPSCGTEKTFASTNIPKLASGNGYYQHGNKSEVAIVGCNSPLPNHRPDFQDSTGNPNSSCALYLLSTQLEGSSPCPSENHAMEHLSFLGSYSQHFEVPFYDKLLGLESQSFTNMASTALPLAGLKAIENNDFELLNLCAYNNTNVEDDRCGILCASQLIDSENLVSHQHVDNAALLRSSPFLMNSDHPKQEYASFSSLPLAKPD